MTFEWLSRKRSRRKLSDPKLFASFQSIGEDCEFGQSRRISGLDISFVASGLPDGATEYLPVVDLYGARYRTGMKVPADANKRRHIRLA